MVSIGDALGSLSIINPALANLSSQAFFYDVILPFIALWAAFYFFLDTLKIFRASRNVNIFIGAIFAFISTFFFVIGYVGFWIGLIGVVVFRVHGFIWKIFGIAVLFLLLTFPIDVATQRGIVSILTAFFIMLILMKVEQRKWKIIFLILTGIFFYLGTVYEIIIPLPPGLEELLTRVGIIGG
jgi:hypothetical protein